MKTKRILAAILACSMAFGMSVNALAAGELDGTVDGALSGNATVKPATIKVSTPSNLAFSIDPYNLNSKGQVSPSAVTKISNLSNVPVDLVVSSCKATPEGEAVIATGVPAATITTKSAYLLVRSAPTTTAATVSAIKILGTGLDDKFKAATATVAGDIAATAAGAGKGLLLANLVAADCTDPLAPVAKDNTGVVEIGVVGAVATAPTIPWKTADKVKVDLSFRVVPKMPTVVAP